MAGKKHEMTDLAPGDQVAAFTSKEGAFFSKRVRGVVVQSSGSRLSDTIEIEATESTSHMQKGDRFHVKRGQVARIAHQNRNE